MRADSPSILVILLGSIGDVARGVIVVDLLKSALPGCRITWLVEPKSQAVVALHPRVDEVLLFERTQGIAAVPKILRELRSRHFDIALDMQRHLKSGLFSLLSGARRRIGFHRRDSKEGNFLFSTEQIPFCGEGKPKIDHYAVFAEHLGAALPSEPYSFGIDEGAREIPRRPELAGAGPYLVAVLGSAWSSKDWPPSGYAEVIRLVVSQTTAKIVLVGDKSTRPLADELHAEQSGGRVIDLVGRTSLREVIGVLQDARVGFGPDSGPGHLMAALGNPYVALFGATDPVRTAPYLSEELVLRSAIGCSPCYRRRCPGLNNLCMRLLTPSAVVDRLTPFLS